MRGEIIELKGWNEALLVVIFTFVSLFKSVMQHQENYILVNEKLINVLLRLFARNYADCDSPQLEPDLVLKIIEGGFVQASQVARWWWWW